MNKRDKFIFKITVLALSAIIFAGGVCAFSGVNSYAESPSPETATEVATPTDAATATAIATPTNAPTEAPTETPTPTPTPLPDPTLTTVVTATPEPTDIAETETPSATQAVTAEPTSESGALAPENSTETPNGDDKDLNPIPVGAVVFWSIVSLIAGIWIGIFIGSRIWKKKSVFMTKSEKKIIGRY